MSASSRRHRAGRRCWRRSSRSAASDGGDATSVAVAARDPPPTARPSNGRRQAETLERGCDRPRIASRPLWSRPGGSSSRAGARTQAGLRGWCAPTSGQARSISASPSTVSVACAIVVAEALGELLDRLDASARRRSRSAVVNAISPPPAADKASPAGRRGSPASNRQSEPARLPAGGGLADPLHCRRGSFARRRGRQTTRRRSSPRRRRAGACSSWPALGSPLDRRIRR